MFFDVRKVCNPISIDSFAAPLTSSRKIGSRRNPSWKEEHEIFSISLIRMENAAFDELVAIDDQEIVRDDTDSWLWRDDSFKMDSESDIGDCIFTRRKMFIVYEMLFLLHNCIF